MTVREDAGARRSTRACHPRGPAWPSAFTRPTRAAGGASRVWLVLET